MNCREFEPWMIYTAESYEKIKKLLTSLCVSCSNAGSARYTVSRYNSTVCSVRGRGREMFVIGDKVFEIESGDFNMGTREREIEIQLARFSTEGCGHREDELVWRETDCVEFEVGPVDVGGRGVGTLFVFRDTRALDAVGSVLRKFVDAVDGGTGCFERAVVDMFVSNKML